MQISELDKAVEYTKQFIAAATPVAKQAYEIGLLTLRIDAAQVLFYAAVMFMLSLYVLRKVRADWIAAKAKAALPENAKEWSRRGPTDHLFADGMLHVIGSILAVMASAISAVGLLNIWNWTKLFAPQLWLAHKAVEKLIQ